MKPRLFALLACAYLVFASREQPWGDANVVYTTAQSLVEQGRIDVTLGGPVQFYAIRNGKKYGVFPLGNVVAHVPSYLAFKAVRLLPHKPALEALLGRLCSHLSSSLMMAGVGVLLFTLLRREGASERAALWLSLMAGLSTILAIYARVPYSEALQTLAFTWVVERALTVGDRPTARAGAWLGVACGLLFNTKLVYATCIPVVPIYLVVVNRHRLRAALAALLGAGATLAPMVAFAIWHNHLKTGTLLDSGYRIPDGVFSGDAYAALHGFFLSTGKSVFLYSPPLVLGFLALPSYFRARRAHASLLVAINLAVVLVNAKFRYWHADYCWGPRLLVPTMATWLIPVAHWIEPALARGRRQLRALALGGLVGAGLFVQVLGGAFYWDHWIRIAIAVKDQTGAGGWYTEDLHHCHFIPQFSPLVGHAWLMRHKLRRDPDPLELADAPWHRVVPGKVNLASEYGAARFDWWVDEWWTTPGTGRWLAAVLLLLGGGLLASALALRARLAATQVSPGPRPGRPPPPPRPPDPLSPPPPEPLEADPPPAPDAGPARSEPSA